MEKFSPSQPSEATQKSSEGSLSPESQARIQTPPEGTKPGDLNHPMEGGGQGHHSGDGQGGVVTPEMAEKYHSPETQIEKEPYTYRAVPADPAQAAYPGKTPGDAAQAQPADPAQTGDDTTVAQPADPRQKPGDARAAGPTAYEPLAASDNAPPEKPDHTRPLSDRGRAAMQSPPPEQTAYYPPLSDDTKLALSAIQDAPVEQRQQMMADLFTKEGRNLSNNAAVFGDHIIVRDHSGFEWRIDYKK